MIGSKGVAALSVALGLAASVQAVPIYSQCDGIGFTAVACDSGTVCTYLNDWYWQCLPPSSTASSTRASSSSSSSSTSRASSSSSSTSASRASSSSTSSSSTSAASSSASCASSSGNPYTGYGVYLSPYYAAEVAAAVANISDSSVAAKAAKVAKIPTFTWLDVRAKVPTLETYLADAKAQQTASGTKLIVQIVIYDLPNRDCHAKASNGELLISDGGADKYKQYIDDIYTIIAKYPDVRVVIVYEPDSLANLVTNLSDSNCAAAESTYKELTIYGLKKLNLCNVFIYLDAGHAGWLGWTSNLQPAATLFSQIYSSSVPNRVRGLATNVANYNALSAATPDPVTSGNPNTDELKYINAIAPYLTSAGFDAHFIVDQGRSGVQNIRDAWGNWCNIEGAGFGTQPTTSTGSSLIDAIVWVKPGGESDGTSDTSATRYDSTCGLADAKKPAPEAGSWFQAYFVDLVNYANPAL